MKAKLINDEPVTYVAIFETGEDVMEGLERLAQELELGATQLTGIGAFSDAILGYFNFENRDYKKISVTEQVEVLSLIGNVTWNEGKRQVHAHVILGRSDATTLGGHLISATVRPTLEIILTESPQHLERKFDPAAGLPLINL
ncbi:MAG: PPC domain-containing DNA-binding protein [Verrucomicrobiota bacterium]|jgi:predicted DNA-binding protein with PD1-like motif